MWVRSETRSKGSWWLLIWILILIRTLTEEWSFGDQSNVAVFQIRIECVSVCVISQDIVIITEELLRVSCAWFFFLGRRRRRNRL